MDASHAGNGRVRRNSRTLAALLAAAGLVLGFAASPAGAATPQTITFGPLSNVTYGVAPIAISATGGGSGNPVTFSGNGSDSGICTVTSNGDSTGSVTVVHAGTCTVLANQAGGGSFAAAGQVTQSFTIAKATLTLTPDNANQVYGTTASLGVSISGFQNGDTAAILTGSPSCSTSATALSPVSGNPYTINCTVGTTADTSGNYVFAVSGTGTLTVVPAGVTVVANNQTITYGQPDPAFTFHTFGLIGSDTLTTTPTCGVSGAHANAGTYSIGCSGAAAGSNYTISYQAGSLVINRATVTVTANNAGISYGQSLPSFSFTPTGFFGSDGFTTAPTCGVSGSPTQVGSYPIICAGGNAGGNYNINYVQGTFTIGQAGVTIAANSQTITYGQNDPTFTFTVSGLKNGDSLSTTPTCGVSGNHRNVGTYSIVCSGAEASGNYAYTYVAGTLQVTSATLTITAENETKVYGQGDPQFAFQATGFIGADTLETDPTCGVTGVHVHVSSYPISCSGANAGSNYIINYVPATLTITKALLTVTANSATRTYGVANAPLTDTITGFQNGDTTASLSGSPSLSTTATTTSDTGRYPITASVGTLTSSDYSFATVNGTLTINAASVNVVAATVHTAKSTLTDKITLSATITNTANSADAAGITALFTATNKAGKIFQCSAVSLTSGVASCTIHVGTPSSLNKTTYTVQTQPNTDYLPGSASGSLVN